MEIEVGGVVFQMADLVRLADVLAERFPELAARCALHSGNLAVAVTVQEPWPSRALERALVALGSAFDHAGLDGDRVSEIVRVKLDAEPRAASSPRALPEAHAD